MITYFVLSKNILNGWFQMQEQNSIIIEVLTVIHTTSVYIQLQHLLKTFLINRSNHSLFMQGMTENLLCGTQISLPTSVFQFILRKCLHFPHTPVYHRIRLYLRWSGEQQRCPLILQAKNRRRLHVSSLTHTLVSCCTAPCSLQNTEANVVKSTPTSFFISRNDCTYTEQTHTVFRENLHV